MIAFVRGIGCALALVLIAFMGFPDWYPKPLQIVAVVMMAVGVALMFSTLFTAAKDNRKS